MGVSYIIYTPKFAMFCHLKKFLKDLEIIKIIKVNSLKERHFYSELKIWAISAQDALVIADIILREFPFLNFFFLFPFLLSKIPSPHLFSFIYLIFLLPFSFSSLKLIPK